MLNSFVNVYINFTFSINLCDMEYSVKCCVISILNNEDKSRICAEKKLKQSTLIVFKKVNFEKNRN